MGVASSIITYFPLFPLIAFSGFVLLYTLVIVLFSTLKSEFFNLMNLFQNHILI